MERLVYSKAVRKNSLSPDFEKWVNWWVNSWGYTSSNTLLYIPEVGK